MTATHEELPRRYRSIHDVTEFREVIADFEADVVERTGAPVYQPFHDARAALADAADGLSLTPHEWSVLRWFLSWDETEAIASIIQKARAQGARR